MDNAELTTLLDDCARTFGPAWEPQAASEIHRRIESAAQLADVDGLRDFAESLLELSIFLCSFVDPGANPSLAAQTRIGEMCRALSPEALVDGQSSAQSADDGPGRGATSSVVLMVAPGRADIELAAALAERKIFVRQVDSLEALSGELVRRRALAVVLSADWLDEAARAVAAVERSHEHELTQPCMIALAPPGDRTRRLFAVRAGVEQVFEQAPASELADRIAGFLMQRRHSSFRVLIVEDDRAQAVFAQKVLAHRGIETEVAANAEEALVKAETFRPDLCLLDLNLPDRNGIELAQLLREMPSFEFVQIVFLTAEDNPDAKSLALRLGADDWIVKPVRPRNLISVIEGRAQRARRSGPRTDSGGVGREAAKGLHARRRLVDSIARQASKKESHGMLVAISPVGLGGAVVEVDWVDQAMLGGQLAQALRASSLVRSEVCQAESTQCLFVADTATSDLTGLTLMARGLAARRWLSAESPVQLEFALAAVALDESLTPQASIVSVLEQLTLALTEEPRIRLISGAEDSDQPAGWSELRAMFRDNSLSRNYRLTFSPLLPVLGERAAQYAMRPVFDVTTSQGETLAPDYRAFARAVGLFLKLDQWTIARALDRLRVSREKVALVVEVCSESIESPQLAAWLQAELVRRKLPKPDLTLVVPPERLRAAPGKAARLLQPFVALGVRIALGPLTEAPADLELARLTEVAMLTCLASNEAPWLPQGMIDVARDGNKLLWVDAADDPRIVAPLFGLPVHYLSGEAISTPLPRPEFAFPDD